MLTMLKLVKKNDIQQKPNHEKYAKSQKYLPIKEVISKLWPSLLFF